MKRIEVYAQYFVKNGTVAEFEMRKLDKAKTLVQTLAKNQLEDRIKGNESLRSVELRPWENDESKSYWWGVCPFGQDDDVKLDWPLLIVTGEWRTKKKKKADAAKTERVPIKQDGSERIAAIGQQLRGLDIVSKTDKARNIAGSRKNKGVVSGNKNVAGKIRCVLVCRWLGFKTYMNCDRGYLDKLLHGLACFQMDFEASVNQNAYNNKAENWAASDLNGQERIGVCSSILAGRRMSRKIRNEDDPRLSYPYYYEVE